MRAHHGQGVAPPLTRRERRPVRAALEPEHRGAEHPPFGQVVPDPRSDRAEILADGQGPGRDRLASQHADHGPVVILHVGALVRTHPGRHPPEPEQAHHVVDAQAAGVPQGRVDQIGQRRVPPGGQPLRMPGRLAPVLATLVELIRRGPHADPGDHHVLTGPGVRTTRMAADREVLDDADAHPGGPGRLLGGGQLAVGEPLQPGVEQGLARQPGPFGRHLGRADRAQRFRPGAPVRPVNLGQRAPQAPVLQWLARMTPVSIELGPALGGHRLPVDDLQGGPLGPPHVVTVEQLAGGVAGPQRRGEGVDPDPVSRGEPRVLGDVLDPQIQRAGEAPAHRQVRRLAQRRQRLPRVQRVDQDEPGPQVAGAPRGQIGQVAQVPVSPRLAGPHRVELDSEAPGAVLRPGHHGSFDHGFLDHGFLHDGFLHDGFLHHGFLHHGSCTTDSCATVSCTADSCTADSWTTVSCTRVSCTTDSWTMISRTTGPAAVTPPSALGGVVPSTPGVSPSASRMASSVRWLTSTRRPCQSR